MPIYEYQASDSNRSCDYCRDGFEVLQKISEAALKQCPECGNEITKQISAPSIGASQSGFDNRAKKAGFSKLKKLGSGEYEKQY